MITEIRLINHILFVQTSISVDMCDAGFSAKVVNVLHALSANVCVVGLSSSSNMYIYLFCS